MQMQMQSPTNYESYESDSEESDSQKTSTTDGISDDARLSAQDQWRAQGLAWINGPGRTVSTTGPGQPDTGLGLYNTAFKYAEERRISVLMLDSLDRDQAVYPLPTSLRLSLPRRYRNIERIDIVQVKFLSALYAISEARGNSRLSWISDGSANHVDIPDGSYTIQQLVDELAALLTHVRPSLSVTYNCTAGRFVIADLSAMVFELPWASTASSLDPTEWGLGWNLGFGGPARDMSGTESIMASHMPRLVDDYIFLRLNDSDSMNDVDHTSPENIAMAQDSTGQVAHYFGKLLLNNFGCWAQTFIESPKRFRPVLGRLDHLCFDWVDRHGRPLTGADAATCDWHMTVRITEIVEGQAATASLTMAGPPS